MSVAIVGFHPHSPTCSRVASAVIEASSPAVVLIQLPPELSCSELLLDHEFPIALFSHRRRSEATDAWWLPITAYSPQLVAARAAVASGARVRFIDLPAWHTDALDVDDIPPAAAALRRTSGIATREGLWDHLVESHDAETPIDELARRIDTFFDMIGDPRRALTSREMFMAAHVRAAVDEAGDRPVVVVCRGESRPRLIDALSDGIAPDRCTDVPGTVGETGSYLVPFSYARMSEPGSWWYQQLWTHGPKRAPELALKALVVGLRSRGLRVSTPDVVNMRVVAQGLARIRGRYHPARVDLLDAAASVLISESISTGLPWHDAGDFDAVHPLIAQCSSIFRGSTVGRLHPDTSSPDVTREVEQLIVEMDLATGPLDIDLTDRDDLSRSRILHRFRVLTLPGFELQQGDGAVLVDSTRETWQIDLRRPRDAAATESAAHGPTVQAACAAVMEQRCVDAAGFEDLEAVVADAVLTATHRSFASSSDGVLRHVGTPADLAAGGRLLRTVLELWRHDRVFGTRGNPHLGLLVGALTSRVLELAAATRGSGVAEPGRPAAIKAVSDAQTFASDVLLDDPVSPLAAMATDAAVPFDVRGAALGACWQAGRFDVSRRAMQSIDHRLVGDWLLGLFVVAREVVISTDWGRSILGELEQVVAGLTDEDFAVALPSLRQAFQYFPPRERQLIAQRISPRVAEASVEPSRKWDAAALDARVTALLSEIGLR